MPHAPERLDGVVIEGKKGKGLVEKHRKNYVSCLVGVETRLQRLNLRRGDEEINKISKYILCVQEFERWLC